MKLYMITVKAKVYIGNIFFNVKIFIKKPEMYKTELEFTHFWLDICRVVQ